jgi:hypothetical protein
MSYLSRNEIREMFYSRFKSLLTNGLPNHEPPIAPLVLRSRGLAGQAGATYIPNIRWQNIQDSDFVDNGKHWLHFQLMDLVTKQKSLTGGRQAGVGTHYETRGIARVDLYFSKSAYQTNDADILSIFVQRCFLQQTTECGIFFKNATINDLPPAENYFRASVIAEYSYETIVK